MSLPFYRPSPPDREQETPAEQLARWAEALYGDWERELNRKKKKEDAERQAAEEAWKQSQPRTVADILYGDWEQSLRKEKNHAQIQDQVIQRPQIFSQNPMAGIWPSRPVGASPQAGVGGGQYGQGNRLGVNTPPSQSMAASSPNRNLPSAGWDIPGKLVAANTMQPEASRGLLAGANGQSVAQTNAQTNARINILSTAMQAAVRQALFKTIATSPQATPKTGAAQSASSVAQSTPAPKTAMQQKQEMLALQPIRAVANRAWQDLSGASDNSAEMRSQKEVLLRPDFDREMRSQKEISVSPENVQDIFSYEDNRPAVGRVMRYYRYGKEYAEKYGWDPALVLAIIHQESKGRPMAKSYTGKRFGLGQHSPASFEDAFRGNKEMQDVSFERDHGNPDINIHATAAYLARIRNWPGIARTGDPRFYLMAYNRGPATLAAQMREFCLGKGLDLDKMPDKRLAAIKEDMYNTLAKEAKYDEQKVYAAGVLDLQKKYQQLIQLEYPSHRNQ